MKKFISMVMAAAMVVSLVPATAFAASASLKVDDVVEWTKQEADVAKKGEGLIIAGPQLQLKLTDVDGTIGKVDTYEVKLSFDNAEFTHAATNGVGVTVPASDNGYHQTFDVLWYDKDQKKTTGLAATYSFDAEDSKVTLNIKEDAADDFQDGDIVYINVFGNLEMTSSKVGAQATVKVTGDLGDTDAKVIAAVVDAGIDAEIDDTVDVAEEEVVTLEDITIEPVGGDTFGAVMEQGDEITLKLSKGFEFAKETVTIDWVGGTYDAKGPSTYDGETKDAREWEDNEFTLFVNDWELASKEIVLSGLVIEATSAKAGDVATLTVKGSGLDAVKVEVATVVEQGLEISVDEDEDVPVMWSGVDAANTWLTADADEHEALEVTIEETFVGSYSDKDEIELVLPEGVWVTDVKVTDEEVKNAADADAVEAMFAAAYQEGDHKSFIFEKRTFDETEPNTTDKELKIAFELTLVADPGFVGDVELEMLVDGESKGKVLIAKFETPLVVEAEQNDLKIDYRNTAVPTDVVVKEAEAGLWKEGFTLGLGVEYMNFEDDATFTVNEESEMEIDDKTTKVTIDGDSYAALSFEVDEESDDEAAVITISDMELYMSRNLAAGAYDLEIVACNAIGEFNDQVLFAPDCGNAKCDGECTDKNDDCIVDDVTDYSSVVKEAFVNVVTAGREQDDASFTTKVVVTIGAMELIAGETVIALDVPAYINAEGYTMLPIRAVATALGINNDAVIWSQAAKQVTILYGQRVITMTVGSNVMYVNGSAIPTSAAVEIVNGRTFLPLRDLATALGVTDITWDQPTKTATLNGGK